LAPPKKNYNLAKDLIATSQ